MNPKTINQNITCKFLNTNKTQLRVLAVRLALKISIKIEKSITCLGIFHEIIKFIKKKK